MAKLTINKSLLDKEILLERETQVEILSMAIYDCREVRGLFVIARVNETIIPAQDWHLFKLNTFDHIQLTARPEKGALPYIGAVVGAVIGYYVGAPAEGAYTGWAMFAAAVKGAAIGYSLGSMADALFFPVKIQQFTDAAISTENPNYGWDGARLITQPGGPKTVLYGQHRISGALIMQYVSTDGANNYLNMLVNLGHGEIEGVMKADGTGVCTTGEVTEEETTSGSINVADVDDFYEGSGVDVNTGTFSSLPAHTRTLTVNGVMKGCFISIYSIQYYIYARPVFHYKSGGVWLQKNGNYTNLTYHAETPFSFSVETINADITEFYVTFNYSALGGSYSTKIYTAETYATYEYLHLTTYTATTYSFDSPDVEINGQPFRYFENMTWDYRLGTYNQTVIDGFHETQTFYGDGRKIEAPITYTTTGIDIDAFEVQLTCPLLYQQDSVGNIIDNSVTYKIEYQVVGAGSWTDGGTYTITGATKTKIYEYRKFENLTPEQYNIRITRISPVYTSFRKAGDLHLGGITEIVYENIAYRNSALLALNLQANEQLSGTTPNITALVRGLKILVPKLTISAVIQTYDDCYWDDGAGVYKRTSDNTICTDTGEYVRQWSRNPIWCSRDFILNKRYGLGNYIDSDSFNETAAAIEAKYCWELVTDFNGGTEHRFEMDLPISNYMSAQEALKMLGRCFRGWFVWSNGMYKPVIDREKDPEQLFDGSNIKPGSIRTTYLKASQIPNIVEIQYADPDRSYNIEPIEVVDEDEWTNDKPPRPNTINAIGTVRKSENIRTGKYYLNCAKNVTKLQEFISSGDAINCEPGDTIRLQNDLLAWGVGGRVVAAASSSITTNIDITYTAGHEVRVRLPDFSLEVRTVSSVTNNGRTINVSAPFTVTPLIDSIFTYGAPGVDSKPFKVRIITRLESDDKEREWYKLLVAEESSNKYNDTTGVSLPDPKYTTLINPTQIPANVTDLTMTEMANQPGFYVAFNIPQNDFSFHHADLFLSLDNINWWPYLANITSNSNIEVLGAKPGQTYYAKVVAYNRFGIANLSPVTANLTITDTLFIPPNVNGLRLDGEASLNTTIFTKKDAKFVWRKVSMTSGAGRLPAGQESLGAGEFYDEVSFKYWVEIWVSGIKVRKEIISENAYVYSYEKNAADNGTATNTFTIMVWAYNEDANYKSINSASLTVINTAPAAVSGLTSTPWMEAIKFSWQPNTEIDFDYYKIRYQVETDGWSSWTDYSGTEFFRPLTETEVTVHGSDATIYFEIKAIDTFWNESETVAINADCLGLNIQSSDIEEFAITASKIFTKIPVITGDTWTDNSPSAGFVAWNEHTLYYNGAAYTIAAGNASGKYIWWINAAGGYSSGNENPELSDGDFIIATNISGAHDLAWNAIANQVIGSAYIQKLAVLDQHVVSLAASKISAGTISGITITGSTFQTASTGKRIILNSTGLTLHVTSSVGKYSTFKYGDGTKYGSGALAYIHHTGYDVPFYIAAEQTVADFHFFNRSVDPTGVATEGDMAVVDEQLAICVAAGTPGDFRRIGPVKHAFSATATGQLNIAVNTEVTILFGSEVFDIGSNFASNTFTAPIDGKYQFNALIRFNNIPADAGYIGMQLLTSNRTYYYLRSIDAVHTYLSLQLSILADMDASDTAHLTIYQAGGTQQMDIEGGGWSFFNGYWVCD